MARQNHPFPFSGKLGKLSFFEHKVDGHMVRERKGPSKKRLFNDPRYKLTRYAMSEFAEAGNAVTLVRDSINEQLKGIADARMISRITGLFREIVNTDAVNNIGLRKVSEGSLSPLNGFEFNAATALNQVLPKEVESSINRATGLLSVQLPSLVPANEIKMPDGATHFEILTIGAAYDFAGNKRIVVVNGTGKLPIDTNVLPARTLDHQLPANSTDALFLFLGISFYTGGLNGFLEKMSNSVGNALKIINIDQA